MAQTPEVLDIHHVHIWLLTDERPVLTVHARVAENVQHDRIVSEIHDALEVTVRRITRYGATRIRTLHRRKKAISPERVSASMWLYVNRDILNLELTFNQGFNLIGDFM